MKQNSTLLLILILSPIIGCEGVRDFGKRDVKLAALAYVDREDNFLVDDRYRLNVVVFHEEPNSIKGKYVVRAYGDVFGEGGQVNPILGDNYDETTVSIMDPGRAGGMRWFYYINNPAVVQNNLDPDVVKAYVNMRIEIDFIPMVDDAKYKMTAATVQYARGSATIATRN
jgi:hypothetical protein